MAEQAPAQPPAARRIDGSIGVSTGDVTCEGDLTVGGNILDARQVRAGGSVNIGGVIQAATVIARGELCAAGGISGRGKADCRAGGGVAARYIVKATVEARGNVRAETEILGAEVHTTGDVLIEAGTIISSSISAGGVVRCRKIGTAAETKTFVAAGVDLKLEAELTVALPQIELQRARAVKIREIVAPLLKNQRSLNAAQKEKATELLFEADELDAGAARRFGEFRTRAQALAPASEARIHVSELICAGVLIRVGEFEATIDSALAGPISIVLRGAGSHKRLAMVDLKGAVLDLKSRPVQSAGAQLLARLRVEHPAPAVPAALPVAAAVVATAA